MLAKIGPGINCIARTAGGAIFFDDLGAGDVGRHQVGSELNAFEREIENVGDGADEQRLCESGHAGDDRVAADKEREQHLFDDFVLSDDGLSDFAQQALTRCTEFVEQLLVANG